jgi:hypothetical protein
MSNPSRRREDVHAWPTDQAARVVLETYLDELTRNGPHPQALQGNWLDFRGASLGGMDLAGAVLFGSNLERVSLKSADLGKALLQGANLRFSDFSLADLTKVDATQCDATGANFRGARLFGAEVDFARMVDCDLRETVLNGGKLLGTDLTRADLRGASLPGALFGDDEVPTILTNARVFGCNLYGASGVITGPVDIGEHEPALVDGQELLDWFVRHEAPEVRLAM